MMLACELTDQLTDRPTKSSVCRDVCDGAAVVEKLVLALMDILGGFFG